MPHELSFLCLFFPCALLGLGLARRRGEGAATRALLAASLLYCLLLDRTTFLFCLAYAPANFLLVRFLARRPGARRLGLVVAANLLLLAGYKYGGALIVLAAAQGLPVPSVLAGPGAAAGFIAPLGLSFLVFRAIGAAVEIRGGRAACPGWAEYLLYLLYFPTFLAGPIATLAEVSGRAPGAFRPLGHGAVVPGLCFVGIGLFKKTVLAQGLAPFAAGAFSAAATGNTLHFLEAWGAALAYTFELYFDFSGYSDMAVGLSALCGLALPANFDAPYTAASIREFWRRWHMTLSRFLRDNLYIPLGGNRRGQARALFNVMAVMVLCGLWHGSGATFAVWGGLHGLFLVIDHLWRGKPTVYDPSGYCPRTWTALCRVVTFTSVVLAWVVFRAETMEAAMAMWRAMATPTTNLFAPFGAPGSAPEAFAYLPGWRVWLLPEGTLPHFGGLTQCAWLALGFGLTMLLPSSQAWLAGAGWRGGAPAARTGQPACPVVAAGAVRMGTSGRGGASNRVDATNQVHASNRVDATNQVHTSDRGGATNQGNASDRPVSPVASGPLGAVLAALGHDPGPWRVLAAGTLFALGLGAAFFTATPSPFLYARF